MRAISTYVQSVTGQCRGCGAMMSVDLRPVEHPGEAHVAMPTGQGPRYYKIDHLTRELRAHPRTNRLYHYAQFSPPNYCGGDVALIGGFAPVEQDVQPQRSSLLSDSSLSLGTQDGRAS